MGLREIFYLIDNINTCDRQETSTDHTGQTMIMKIFVLLPVATESIAGDKARYMTKKERQHVIPKIERNHVFFRAQPHPS